MRRCAYCRLATLVALLAALFLTTLSALAGTLTPVKLRVGGKEVALKTPAVYDGREVYLPLESLEAFGATYTMGRREETALILLPTRIRLEVALARPGRQPMVPLSVLAPPLNQAFAVRDGVCVVGTTAEIARLTADHRPPTNDERRTTNDHRPTTQKTEVKIPKPDERQPVLNTSAKPGEGTTTNRQTPPHDSRLTTHDSPPEAVQRAQSPDDMGSRTSRGKEAGNKEAGNKTAVKTGGNQENRTGTAPFNPQSVFNTGNRKPENRTQANDPVDPKTNKTEPPKTEVKKPDAQRDVKKPDTQKTDLQPMGSVDLAPWRRTDETLSLDLPPFGMLPTEARSAAKVFAPSVHIQDVAFEPLKGDRAQVRIKTRGKPDISVRYLREPSRLAIDIPSSTLETEKRNWKLDHPFLSGMQAGPSEKPGTTRVFLDLASLVGYRIEPASDNGVVLTLLKPTGVGRRLQNMTIVIDPGHGGGSSTGCSAVVNGVRVYEKNLTLSIAKKLQTMLTEVGVDVIMTRTSDADVSLRERPEIANRNGAHLFVSIHVDDCGIPNSASGSTAYYHMNDPSSRALAHSIIERVGKVSGMPNRGARSDSVRFRTGMAVLRYAAIPAVLIETAYINNDRDRKKLMDEEFQLVLARAMFNGIHAYTEGALPEDTLSPMGMN